jgi:Asp-tRNA(Asn)/Glu-tRNA(Gln) amidotransferase A subunit family amidase
LASQLRELADEIGPSLTDADLKLFTELMRPSIGAYNVVDAMPNSLSPVRYPRTPGHRATGEENKHNAWYVKSTVQGAAGGRLKGKRIVLKDNVMLAGVPMMNGASTLEGYVPDVDATIVQRTLDAGGSSSGSAALVALGEADMAIGGDQGGSIRIPSSLCGTYGMKPTHGLVPYTGIMPIEVYVDHTGPITATAADNAVLLEVLAGPAGYDPRQYAVRTHSYGEAAGRGVKGMKIALVKEGFELGNAGSDVNEKVRAAAKRFEQLGAYIKRHHGGRYYGKAMNVCRLLTAAYDGVLAEHDLLIMPTTPIKASKLLPPDATREEYVDKAISMIDNTCPFDITHHPAMAVPCGMSEGLPVSLILVAKHFDEPAIHRAAFAFEQTGDWKAM